MPPAIPQAGPKDIFGNVLNTHWVLPTQTQDQPQTQAPKKAGGLKGVLESFLPTVGGALGAIGGSFVGPLGTAGGGAAGSAAGEFLKEKLTGEKTNVGNIAKEAAFGALPGAAEGLGGGIKAARAGEGFLSGLVGRGITGAGEQAATEGAANLASDAAPVAQTASKGIVNTVQNAAKEADASASGFGVGTTINGKTITPDRANELYEFARDGSAKYASTPVKAGTPFSQAQQAQDVFNGVNASLDSKLAEINRPLVAGEAESVANNAIAKAADNGLVGAKTPTLDKAVSKITALEEDGDFKGLEDIRKQYDNIAYTARGAGKTSAAAQASSVRDAIDEFIHGAPGETPRFTDYKDIKGDYSKAKDLLELTSKGVKTADTSIGGGKGVFGAVTGSPLTKGVKSKVASVVASPTASATGTFLKALTKQGISQGVGNALTAPPQNTDETAQSSALDSLSVASPQSSQDITDTSSPFDPANVNDNIQKIIAQGGKMKDVSDYLSNVKAVNDLSTSGGIPKAQQTLLSNATRATGLIDTVYGQFQALGGAQGRVGGFLSGLSGKAGLNSNVQAYNTARTDAAIPLAQALSGSTRLPPPETLKLVEDMLPNFGDNQQEVEVKKTLLQQRLASAISAIKTGALTSSN